MTIKNIVVLSTQDVKQIPRNEAFMPIIFDKVLDISEECSSDFIQDKHQAFVIYHDLNRTKFFTLVNYNKISHICTRGLFQLNFPRGGTEGSGLHFFGNHLWGINPADIRKLIEENNPYK